ncbi:hypothetical protein KCU95_g5062, partial [Aureobasidium melanogenum]
MINSADQLFEDDETTTIASTGMMTPTSEGFGLQRELPPKDGMGLPECVLIFESDTPASLELEDRAKLTFMKPVWVEAMDVSKM